MLARYIYRAKQEKTTYANTMSGEGVRRNHAKTKPERQANVDMHLMLPITYVSMEMDLSTTSFHSCHLVVLIVLVLFLTILIVGRRIVL